MNDPTPEVTRDAEDAERLIKRLIKSIEAVTRQQPNLRVISSHFGHLKLVRIIE